MASISKLPIRVSVSGIMTELAYAGHLWDKHTLRTTQDYSPHASGLSDIWVRFNPLLLRKPSATLEELNTPHFSEWYPARDWLPSLEKIVARLHGEVKWDELGGVLITRLRAGHNIAPHVDTGWHAGKYNKYAVQIMGDEKQRFCFEDSELVTFPGDVYTFDNSKLHWVENGSTKDRMTLIICAK